MQFKIVVSVLFVVVLFFVIIFWITIFKCLFSRLLDILATRKDPQGLSGVVLINGKEQPRNFRLASGYVVQVSKKLTSQITVILDQYFQTMLSFSLSE